MLAADAAELACQQAGSLRRLVAAWQCSWLTSVLRDKLADASLVAWQCSFAYFGSSGYVEKRSQHPYPIRQARGGRMAVRLRFFRLSRIRVRDPMYSVSLINSVLQVIAEK